MLKRVLSIRTAALWAVMILVWVIVLPIPWARAAASPPTTVRVGIYENPPKVYTNPDGIVAGIFPDILDTIAHEKGWHIDYLFGTWEQCLQRLEENKIDIMVDIAFSRARGKKFLFSDESVFLNWAAVYTQNGTIAESLLDLKGKTIAVVSADIHTVGDNGIEQLDNKFELNLSYVHVDSYRQVFEALDRGDVEAGIVNRLYGSVSEKKYDITRSPLIFNPVRLKFAFSRTNPRAVNLRRDIDQVVGELKKDSDSVFHEIINSYLAGVEFDRRFKGEMRTVVLTKTEKIWLRQHPTLRIGVDPNYPPYSFIDPDGHYQGVAMDFIRLIGDHLGLNIEVVDGLDWPRILDGARNRSLDLVLTATNREDRKDYLAFSDIYIPTPLVIMARENDDKMDGPEDLDGQTVALVNRYASAEQVMKAHPTVNPVMVPTPIEGLTKVCVGEADYYVGVLGINDYLMHQHGISNLKVAARYDMRFGGQSVGVRSDWPELIAILNKALTCIPEKKKIAMFNAWIPMGAHLDGPAALQHQYALTAEETAWIKDHPVIRCGIDPEFLPFEYVAKDGSMAGIASDYINILSSRLGLNFEVATGLSWREVTTQAENREIDVLPCVARTREREKYHRFSIPYAKFHRVIITPTDTPFLSSLDDIRDRRVAVQANSSHAGYLKDHTDITPIRFDTLQEALRAVSEGSADAFVGNIASATYWIRKQHLTNLKVAAPVSYEVQKLHFAVRKDWPTLVGIIDKGLSSISLAKEDKIRKKWIDVEYKPGLNPGDIWKYMLKGLGGALFILIAILAWNYQLKKEIVKRKKVEQDLTYRLEFETLLLEMSSLFISLKTEQISNELNIALKHIAEFISADSGFVFRLSDDGSCISNTHGWFSGTTKTSLHAFQEMDVTQMPFLTDLLKKGEVLSVPAVDNLPPTAANEKHFLLSLGIKAIVSIPMKMGGSTIGFLGIASTQARRVWSDDEIALLEAVGQIFCNALQRKKTEEALQQTHNELECRIEERTADLAMANRTLQQEINDRKQMEIEKENLAKQLMQSQKMEAIGTMAGGIAHDFNNILMPIMGYTELTLSNLDTGSKDRDYLQQVIRASHRAKDLVKQILTFSRQDENEKRPIEINPLVKETVKLLRSSLPSTIEIRETIDSSDGCILGCPTQIHQVVMNLCTNAYHAMRMQGGVLGVTVSHTLPTPVDDTVPPALIDDGFVRLTISDTGHGIDPSIKDRILEPYFTTKPAEEGTGLGLSVVHGIVKSHKGHLTFESEPEKGTTFHLFFPRIARSDVPVETGMVKQIRGGHETIWVLDDDAMIAHMEKSMLAHFGYPVRVFTDSQSLWEAFQSSTNEVDLVVTDMTMPKMTGAELAEKIIGVRPDLPIVICSGFSETINDQKARAKGICEFIMKPVVMNDLAEAVRRLLDEKARPAS
ncbi:transporter substrate-binding domain-containing protein [Desulfosarcina variabilis]|uniref:transporter substrate-binding domain-containing protein n=1 Tax=Desulfosarcina variabilis TaxID=2300 RepID=UPI003AFA1B2C